MKYLVIALGVLVLIVIALSGGIISSMSSNNPIKQAEMQATAAVIYAQMTPSPTVTLTPIPGTPTLSVVDVASTLAHQQQSVQITQQAMQQNFELQKLEFAGTSTALQSTSIAFAGMQTSQAGDTQTAIAQATAAEGTKEAQGTEAAQTAIAATSTEQMRPTSDMRTQQAVFVIQTIDAGNAIQVDMAAKQAQSGWWVKAFLGPVIILVLCAAFIWLVAKWIRVRAFSRDEAGRPKTIVHEQDGNIIVNNQDRNPAGIIVIKKNGGVEIPTMMDQAKTTERAQIVDGIAQLPPGRESTGNKMMSGLVGGNNTPSRIILHGDGSLADIINAADASLMEDE